MKAVHFGAGNIGRGFIGLLLSRSGYDVVFSDVNRTLVDELRRRGEYTVTLAEDEKRQFRVTGVTAIDGSDADAVAAAVAEADLVTTAVGVNILRHIASGIARGIEKRIAAGGGPLTVIACENTIGGSTQLKEHVYGHLDEAARTKASGLIAFPDAAVDRIVPIQRHDDPLAVTVEPFYEWVVDSSALPEGSKPIEGVHYVDDLVPYIERKLFTVNTGHCAAAYLGNLKGHATIQQAMADESVAAEVKATLGETGAVLVERYGFDAAEHEAYIRKIVDRFRNPHLTDEVSRVGRSPIRKLSPNDRLVKPAMQAYELGAAPKQLARVIAAALFFDEPEDPEAVALQQDVRAIGAGETIAKYTSIPKDHAVFRLVMEQYESMAAAHHPQ